MRISAFMCDRRLGQLLWGTAISFSITISGVALSSAVLTQPADANSCCRPVNPCCPSGRSEILFPPPPASEEYVLTLSSIDPSYVLTRVLLPVIYASLIIRIIWLIQRK